MFSKEFGNGTEIPRALRNEIKEIRKVQKRDDGRVRNNEYHVYENGIPQTRKFHPIN